MSVSRGRVAFARRFVQLLEDETSAHELCEAAGLPKRDLNDLFEEHQNGDNSARVLTARGSDTAGCR